MPRIPHSPRPGWVSTLRLVSATLALLALAASSIPQPDGRTQTALQAVPAARQADRVAVITIEGEINAVTASSVQRRMTQAIDGGAQALVFDIDTPGGEIGAVLEICAAIKSSAVPNTVAWVNPQAYSGGAIIALACREIVASEAASMGDALPIAIGLGGAEAATQGELRKKIVPPVLAEVVASARERGWDEFIVQAIVIDGVELWWIEEAEPADGTARRLAVNEAEFRMLFPGMEPPRGSPIIVSAKPGGGDETAASDDDESQAASEDPSAFKPASPTLRDLSPALSGESDAESAQDLDMLAAPSERPVFTDADAGAWTLSGYLTNGSGPIVMKTSELTRFGFSSAVIRSDEELRAFFGAQELVRIDRSWSESAVRVLSRFWVRGLLIVVFLVAMFVEMSSPGLILPGLTAIGALVLLMAPAWMLGLAGWWEIVAIGAGIACIFAELIVLPGFGVFGIAGLVLLFAGLVGSFLGPGPGVFSADGQGDLVRALVTVILALVTSGVGIGVIVKQFGKLPVLGRLVLDASRMDDEEAGDALISAMDDPQDLTALIGNEGSAHTPLLPSGKVELDDDLYEAKSGLGAIDAGARVVVVGVEGWQLVVEPSEHRDGTEQAGERV
ncbi:MAG: NfeD family protein [Planctomycetota bacterium]